VIWLPRKTRMASRRSSRRPSGDDARHHVGIVGLGERLQRLFDGGALLWSRMPLSRFSVYTMAQFLRIIQSRARSQQKQSNFCQFPEAFLAASSRVSYRA